MCGLTLLAMTVFGIGLASTAVVPAEANYNPLNYEGSEALRKRGGFKPNDPKCTSGMWQFKNDGSISCVSDFTSQVSVTKNDCKNDEEFVSGFGCFPKSLQNEPSFG